MASKNLEKLVEDLKILYEDNHLIAVEKPVNILTQADKTTDIDLMTIVKEYIRAKYNKPGNIFLGLVHRLDRPVGGAIIFAKTSKAASRLSNLIRLNQMTKEYLAVVNGRPKSKDTWTDYLLKNKKNNMTRVVGKNVRDGKYSELNYKILLYEEPYSLVKISLITGRPHQIRVQFSSRNFPLYGDQRYSKVAKVGQQIALWSHSIKVKHPTKEEMVEIVSNPPDTEPWSYFKSSMPIL